MCDMLSEVDQIATVNAPCIFFVFTQHILSERGKICSDNYVWNAENTTGDNKSNKAGLEHTAQ